MKKLTLITLLAIASLATYAQTLKADIDSTLALLKTQDVDERMATYYSFADRNRFTDYDSVMPILKQYEEDADRNHRQHDADVARKMQFALAVNLGQTKKAYTMIDGFIEKCDKEKSHEIYVDLIEKKIELLLLFGKPQTAFIETKNRILETPADDIQMRAMLYSNMGKLYQFVCNDSMSVLYLTKAIELCKQIDTPNITCTAYYNLCNALQQSKKYDEMLLQTKYWWDAIDKAEKEDFPLFNARLRRVLCLFMQAVAYYNTGNAEELHSAYLQMETLTNHGADLSSELTGIIVFDLILSKKHNEALNLVNQLVEYYNNYLTAENAVWLKIKAEIQYQLGIHDAYLTMKENNELENKIINQTSSNQLNEFATIYEVEQVKSHAKQLRLKMEIAIISATLLLLLAIVIVIYNRRLKQHIKLLCERIDSINTQQTKPVLDSNKQEMAEQDHKGQDSETGSEESNFVSLFDRIEEILRNNDVLASDIDRDELARMAGTNRTYLTNCIRKTTGLSLNDFINTKRVNKAIEMLKENAEMKITDIQAAVGFTSYTTFYRIFNKQFGVTPVDYRNYLLEKMTA